MTILQPICSVLNRWIDETECVEDAAGHNFYKRKQAVQALGRIHYIIWLENLHEKRNITVGNCIWLVFTYGIEIMHDVLTAPFNIIVCQRR